MKTPKASQPPVIFTTYDIGRMTGTDPTTVHKWIDKGLLRGYRTPGGHRRVRAEDLRAFLLAHKMPVPKELGGAEELRMLVVDRDGEALRGLSRTLKRLRPGWEISTAESCVDALLAVSGRPPDVMIFDLAAPEVDFPALCQRLHERPDTSSVKLLAMAARLSADSERKMLGAGAVACLKKPIVGPDLVTIVEHATGRRVEAAS